MAQWSSPSTSVWLGGIFFLALALSLAKLALVVWGSPAPGPPDQAPTSPTPPAPAPDDNNNDTADRHFDVDADLSDALKEAPNTAPDTTPHGPDGQSLDSEDHGLELEHSGSEADRWLAENNLEEHRDLLQRLGISSLVSCATLTELPDFPELPEYDEARLQRAAHSLRQRLILRRWLNQLGLGQYYHRLIHADVTALEDVYWLEDNRAQQLVGKDFALWSAARQTLPSSKDQLEWLKTELWSGVVKESQHEDAWTWGGMLVVSVSVAGLVTLAAMTQPSLAPEAKTSLLQYVTGKYLLPSNCTVTFEWDEPAVVGETVTFTVRFYQRNGQPYPICDTDSLVVEVNEGIRRVATLSELGGTEPSEANIAKVKFTVRHAGVYRIVVLVGNCHVQGSPFQKKFLPGAPNPRNTVFVRHSSTVVCTAKTPYPLHIEPRDEFNNLCTFEDEEDPLSGYTVNITAVGSTEPAEDCSINMEYDIFTSRIELVVCIMPEGCYHACVSYNSVPLHNGEFDILVLSGNDANLVYKNVASKNHNICYEARLVSLNGDRLVKPRRVACYVSPKQITIKDYVFKFFPKRLYTFRLCPSTKFNYLGNNNQHSGLPGFIIDDGSQPKVELVARDRNVLAATFTHFLLKNIGGSETFKDKRDFFYHEVRKMHQKHFHEKLSLRVQREKLLESSMKVTKSFSVSDWCRNFEVAFIGEQGIDWGGVRREWFELVCAALFDSRNKLFTAFSESSNQQALVHPTPAHRRPPHLKLKHLEFAGRIVGKCLYESSLGGVYRQMVRARFTRSFLAQIIGLRVHYKYFEQDDPELYLSKIKYILENDVEEMDLYFIEEEYDRAGQLVEVVELIPNGSKIRVQESTKQQYLDALAQYRLATSVRDEVEAFLKGLTDLVPDNLLSIFDENELELLLCGTEEYNVSDFKANHVINGGSADFRRSLEWFWTAVSNFTKEEMARLLQFTTGCSQLPPGGFRELSPRFQITAAPTFGSLPTAHTCFNQLCLPEYESYEHFEKALRIAINEGAEGFGLF
ncbi:apoptosis-resistant E3 ubiquitin protein ligase 1 isoform X1 [Frankliniella occidentalis]|uniref:HECT-type E3 ubiquitin transferase n=2 Tax=Frankliniella occidentalis TaxID=133901 RepID=A0A6J1S9N0_FRAOC|nr:apoptosis-resistant E3 ubiquitin protein ligase 1 isoform X1 [Frankliniella occidentalis]XP_052123863.1 apoptosis-resistant E3 ubiquitin protein ligase 1 isoform X1 [Frankliniella occidentalis]